ncbi:MAG: hypothetical protein JSV84_16255 [Gemmatimonadota bacterium]|nr:MAG: hypothetical protein JSV84_16255 [Gemmatimonadota bacterium]
MKVLVMALLICLSINLLAQPYEGEKGDVNNDGNLNVLDIIFTSRHIVGIDTLNEQELWRADCNSHKGSCRGDGSVDIRDAKKIVDIIMRLDECLELPKDIDGNIYDIVKIGHQVWMAENLKVTRYRNGDPIPNITSNSEWTHMSTGAYCNYANDAHNVPVYGRLYNWYAVNDSRGLAPEGWHVPTDGEWKQLEMDLGMSQSEADDKYLRGRDEGGKLKATGTIEGGDGLWFSPNTGATNESGFSALPGGDRYGDYGPFYSMGYLARFWSSTELDGSYAWYRRLSHSNSQVYRGNYLKQDGFSVRCVRDWVCPANP